MSSQREDSIPHELRTAAEPRQNRLYPVRLTHVEQVNSSVRLLQFAIPTQESHNDKQQPFSFLPGQWLDVHIPSITQAGGFTITSTPADAQPLSLPISPTETLAGEEAGSSIAWQGRAPFVELAVQESPNNPSAAWLWRPKEQILGRELNIRVGGSFVWPPTGVDLHSVKNVILIAGGVGINPLISILSHLNNQSQPPQPLDIHFLYSSRVPQEHESSLDAVLDQVLFLARLRQIIRSQSQSHRLRISVDLFLTNLASNHLTSSDIPADLVIHPRRISRQDLHSAVAGRDGKLDPQNAVAYVCGPPKMTDEMVELLKGNLGEGGEERVFFEKWW
ncbi:Riboflavin synthase-like beta-barrel [Penicillium macrosclerotiorum]|uniref:Riboflavin synthase-like beta-barrel n=1 Tax=Penicillium macrosclerotiorum TaxID=303699 RepID=UPI002546CF37|nr:Riboflavin synthase-like beta-barrel [Penicillium macrosclerotiorum]KAJ5679548.1 Riboflavin synthase-like beta-barrel [Penicillium macrosclerotiorum]